jgi:hypothetical protein
MEFAIMSKKFVAPRHSTAKPLVFDPPKSDFEKAHETYQEALKQYQSDPQINHLLALREAARATTQLSPVSEPKQDFATPVNTIVKEKYDEVSKEFESGFKTATMNDRKPSEEEFFALRYLAWQATALAPDQQAKDHWTTQFDKTLSVYVEDIAPDHANYKLAYDNYQKAYQEYKSHSGMQARSELYDLAKQARHLSPDVKTRDHWNVIINKISPEDQTQKYLRFNTEKEIKPFRTETKSMEDHQDARVQYTQAVEAYQNNQNKSLDDLFALRALAWKAVSTAPKGTSTSDWENVLDTLAKNFDGQQYSTASTNYAKEIELYNKNPTVEKYVVLYDLAKTARNTAPDPATSAQWKATTDTMKLIMKDNKIDYRKTGFFAPEVKEEAISKNPAPALHGILKKSR